ncbi:MAG: M48 family metalloprotease, partial [Aestuariivirga sp.]
RHANGRIEQQQRASLTQRVSSEVLKDDSAAVAGETRSRALLASFSRQQELEADRIGVRLLAKAGFDPYGASRFLSTLGRSTALRQAATESAGRPDMLATHPSTQERIGQTLSAARQIGAPGIGQRDRASWLSVVDGIAFGGDPKRGAANGRKYVNSALGITFQAPDGMVLDAGTDAVLGQSRGGALALRFEGVRLDAGQTLETYVASGWIEGMATSNVQKLTVDGRPATTAEGKGKDWSFRLAAIQVDDRTYRFILAGRGDEELDAPFRTMVTSFRKIGPSDSSGLRALRIRTISAPAGATPETMADQMADIDQKLEQFLVLNGLDRNAALTPGQRYKIVSE